MQYIHGLAYKPFTIASALMRVLFLFSCLLITTSVALGEPSPSPTLLKSVSEASSSAIAGSENPRKLITPLEKASLRLKVVDATGRNNAIYDFGTITRGRKLTHIFTLSNDTTSTVLLDRVESSCGCTSGVLLGDFHGKEPFLPPGGTARVQVTLNAAKIPPADTTALAGGQVQEQVFVYVAGQPVHAAAILEIRERVTRGVSFDPPVLNFGSVHTAQGTTQVVRVTYEPDLYVPGQTRLVVPKGSPLNVTLQDAPSFSEADTPGAHPKHEWVVQFYRVSIAPHAALGPLNGVLIAEGLNFPGIKQPQETPRADVCLPYVGQVTGAVTAEPAQVIYGIVPQKDFFGKPVAAASDLRRRTQWILLVCSRLHKGTSATFWKQAKVQLACPYLQAVLVMPPAPGTEPRETARDHAELQPPPLVSGSLAQGTFCWLRVSLLPAAPRTQFLTTEIRLIFPDKEQMLLPVRAQL